MSAKRFYVITSGFYDTRVHALVSGPTRPTLRAMKQRFADTFGSANDVVSEVEAHERAEAAGYVGQFYCDVFVDWLVKTDSRFERVDYREVNL